MSELRERIAKVIGPYRREFPGVPWSALEDDLALALLDESEPVAKCPGCEGSIGCMACGWQRRASPTPTTTKEQP